MPHLQGCPAQAASLAVTVSDRNIAQVSAMAIDEAAAFMR